MLSRLETSQAPTLVGLLRHYEVVRLLGYTRISTAGQTHNYNWSTERIDHQAQRANLLALESDAVRVRVVDCPDVCERSNVVLVCDHAQPRRQRDTWLARIHYPTELQAIADWMQNPSGAVPEILSRHVFKPSRKHSAP